MRTGPAVVIALAVGAAVGHFWTMGMPGGMGFKSCLQQAAASPTSQGVNLAFNVCKMKYPDEKY